MQNYIVILFNNKLLCTLLKNTFLDVFIDAIKVFTSILTIFLSTLCIFVFIIYRITYIIRKL